jgi:hypothetical protein
MEEFGLSSEELTFAKDPVVPEDDTALVSKDSVPIPFLPKSYIIQKLIIYLEYD